MLFSIFFVYLPLFWNKTSDIIEYNKEEVWSFSFLRLQFHFLFFRFHCAAEDQASSAWACLRPTYPYVNSCLRLLLAQLLSVEGKKGDSWSENDSSGLALHSMLAGSFIYLLLHSLLCQNFLPPAKDSEPEATKEGSWGRGNEGEAVCLLSFAPCLTKMVMNWLHFFLLPEH